MVDTPRVLHVTTNPEGINRWRTWWPCNALHAAGFTADYCDYADLPGYHGRLVTGGYDLVVTPRYVWAQPWMGSAWIATMRRLGVKWVYDMDDDLLSPEIVEQQMRLHTDDDGVNWPKRLEYERIERTRLLRYVDAVTVENEALATVVRRHTDAPIHVLPNAIDASSFCASMRPVVTVGSDLPITVGWAGGARSELDLAPVARAWTHLARNYPYLHFLVIGHQSELLVNAVPSDRLTFVEWLPLDQYASMLQLIDVGCCSVADTPWNSCKSPIKFFEMTLAGAVCVVSSVLYGNAVTHLRDGMVVPNHRADLWSDYLSLLVQSATLRRALLQEASETVCEQHAMDTQVDTWADVYRTIAASPSNRAVLDA